MNAIKFKNKTFKIFSTGLCKVFPGNKILGFCFFIPQVMYSSCKYFYSISQYVNVFTDPIYCQIFCVFINVKWSCYIAIKGYNPALQENTEV